MLQTRTVEPGTLELLKRLMESIVDADLDISITSEGKSMLITYIDDIKVDFVKMAYPILFPTLLIEGVRMLDLRDIAPMILKAITQRGSKKDFFDIYSPSRYAVHNYKKKFPVFYGCI